MEEIGPLLQRLLLGRQFVYNPLSILKFLKSGGEFIPYWMQTGSPEFIAKYSQDKQFNISDFEQLKVPKDFLNKRELDTTSPESFLTQAGYLSIKDADDDSYTLDFPNNEVRRSSVPYVHFDSNKTAKVLPAMAEYRPSMSKTADPKKAIEQIIEKTNTYKSAGAYGNHQVTLVGLQIDFAERNIVSHQSTRFPSDTEGFGGQVLT
jgi:hypothetical protein